MTNLNQLPFLFCLIELSVCDPWVGHATHKHSKPYLYRAIVPVAQIRTCIFKLSSWNYFLLNWLCYLYCAYLPITIPFLGIYKSAAIKCYLTTRKHRYAYEIAPLPSHALSFFWGADTPFELLFFLFNVITQTLAYQVNAIGDAVTGHYGPNAGFILSKRNWASSNH